MPRDKKQKQAPPAPPPPPLNNPFQAAKARLQEVVRKPEPPKPEKPAPKAGPKAAAPPLEELRLTDEDLFLREMSGVTRMRPPRAGGRRPAEPTVVRAPPRPSEEAEVVAQLADLVQGSGAFDIANSDEYIEGISPGLDAGLLRRLRQGDFAIQGHLDLHGLTAEEAHVEVERFLHEARLQRKRCVLIIHGRGLNSKDQIPVLKERLRVWLNRGRIGRSVLAFSTAKPVDGGAGAVYVLLRK